MKRKTPGDEERPEDEPEDEVRPGDEAAMDKTIEEIVASSKDPDTVLKKLMARIMDDLQRYEAKKVDKAKPSAK